MKNFILKIGVLLFITISSNAQEVSDSIRIADNNCATKLARDYMYRMGIFEKENSKVNSLKSKELLKESEFESEENGVFLISPLSSHRRKLIVLKKGNQIKVLTFNDVNKSLLELIKFFQDIKTNDEEVFKYINAVQVYLQYSKNTIKTNNKIENSDWINCEAPSNE